MACGRRSEPGVALCHFCDDPDFMAERESAQHHPLIGWINKAYRSANFIIPTFRPTLRVRAYRSKAPSARLPFHGTTPTEIGLVSAFDPKRTLRPRVPEPRVANHRTLTRSASVAQVLNSPTNFVPHQSSQCEPGCSILALSTASSSVDALIQCDAVISPFAPRQ